MTLGSSVEQMTARVTHADELAAEAAKLRAALLDQQTGLRGYQLTGDDAFLQPYRTGQRTEQGALDALIIDSTDPDLRTATREVSRAVETWRTTWVLPQLELAAAGDYAAVQEAVATGTGQRLFDQVRGALGRIDLAIAATRSETLAAVDETERFMELVIVLAVLGYGGVLVFGAYWVVSRVGRPLDGLVTTAEAMERGEPVRFVAHRADEIGTLAQTIDRLQDAVQQRYVAASAMAEQSTILNRLSELVSYADNEDAVIRAGGAALERMVPAGAAR